MRNEKNTIPIASNASGKLAVACSSGPEVATAITNSPTPQKNQETEFLARGCANAADARYLIGNAAELRDVRRNPCIFQGQKEVGHGRSHIAGRRLKPSTDELNGP